MSESTTPKSVMPTATCPVRKAPLSSPRSGVVRRYVLAAIGIVFVGVGWVGAFLPGLPTVGPLLLASYCFTRSCPWLEQRLIRNRFFAPFLQYVDGERELPTRARYAAIAMMWTSILISTAILIGSGRSPIWLVTLLVVSGVFGTAAILTFRRNHSRAGT